MDSPQIQSGKSQNYVVVEFPLEMNDGTVPMAVVSSAWITEKDGETFCLWPTNYKTEQARVKAVLRHVELDRVNCVENLVNIKYSSVDYQKTIKKLKLLESYQSVSESDTDVNIRSKMRTRKPNTQLEDFISECSSDEEDVPVPPKFPRTTQLSSNVPKLCTLTTSSSEARSCSMSTSSRTITPTPFQCNQFKSTRVTSQTFSPKVSKPSLSSSSRSTTPISSQCSNCTSSKAVITKLVETVARMEKDIKIIMKSVVNELDTDGTGVQNVHNISQMTTKEELMNLNTQLDNVTEMQKLVSVLQMIGGKDITDTTRRILNQLITNSLACKYNWTGRHSKGSFSELKNIKNLVTVTVRKNKFCRHATVDDIDKAIKLWIRNAPDRNGGRSARKRKSDE